LSFLPIPTAFSQEFLRLRSLGRLNLAEQDCELFLGQLFAAQERFKGVHEEHLDTDKFGKYVHLHLSSIASDNPAQQPIACPFAWRFPFCLGRRQDLTLLIRRQLRTNASRARYSSPQASQICFTFFGLDGHGCSN
jgi:hypothetical protein